MSVFGNPRVIESTPGRWELISCEGPLPGVYDSPSTARQAALLPRGLLERFRWIAEHEGRPVTAEEVALYELDPSPSGRPRLWQRLRGPATA
jgi:hypothetical protein